MNDLELQTKLTREMTSKDFCHQRIFSCYPLLWRLYGQLMSESKSYNFASVFLELIKDFNNERNTDTLEQFDSCKYELATNEIIEFYNIICQVYNSYNTEKSLNIDSLRKIQNITLTNYKEVSMMCRIYIKNDNRSKILCRLATLKKKTNKFFAGIISVEQFMENEIKPQKEFLNVFIDKLKLYEKDQFCIFMLCYDIKKTNKSIFINKNYDSEDPFPI